MYHYAQIFRRAGVEVGEWYTSGDYEGTAIMEVTHKGKLGYVVVAYGSCSECDNAQGFFENLDRTDQEYKEFFESYLPLYSHTELYERFVKQSKWDMGVINLIEWLWRNHQA